LLHDDLVLDLVIDRLDFGVVAEAGGLGVGTAAECVYDDIKDKIIAKQ
jgi:hypothetical protein